MPLIPPAGSNDPFDITQQFLGGNQSNARGFQASSVPTQTGLGTRTGRLPANRTAVTNRKMVHWLVPEGPIVQMYINPKDIRYEYSKSIAESKTKGGFVLQYWGENLGKLTINGTTGTSGIEGINVLYDVYRNEQLAYDPYALYLAEEQRQQSVGGDIFGLGSSLSQASSPGEAGTAIINSLIGASQESFPQSARQTPTLGSLAFTVEMYWSGEVYRGFFTNFSVTENSDKIGLFDYAINFTVTQKRGFRRNFFPWHRSPVFGPSNSNPEFGPPPSFGSLIEGDITPTRPSVQGDVIDPVDSLGEFFTSLFG